MEHHHVLLCLPCFAQDDSSSRQAKNLDVALVHDRLVTIMDDTEQVWPHHLQNLIKVRVKP